MKITNWNYPTNIIIGENKIFELKNVLESSNIKQPLLVVDPFIKQLDFFKQLLISLKQSNISIFCFDNFKSNPDLKDINNGINIINNDNFDAVIALGGGSAIDVAKTLALVAKQSRPLWDFEDVDNNYLRANKSKILPLIAIPTTAGTGSEVSRAAVISDPVSKTKRLIFHPQMLASHVILDPMTTITVPQNLTAATAFDALAHNLEAFFAPAYHPMADGIALEGCRLIKENLLKAFHDGSDINARQNLLVASSMGATAFQKGLGLIHSLSHPIGAMFGHHHGLLNAIFMPYSLLYNRSAIEEKCLRLANYLELPKPGFIGCYNFVIDLLKQTSMPLSLKQFNMIPDAADEIALKAFKDPSTATNAKPLTVKDLKQIYLQALTGEEVSGAT